MVALVAPHSTTQENSNIFKTYGTNIGMKTPMDSPGEDSLDAFMNATVAELRQDKGDKLQKRLEDKTKQDETR